MKTIKADYKNILLITLSMLFLLITACSKDDSAPPPEVIQSSEKQILSVVFPASTNPIDTEVIATINEQNKTIIAMLPSDSPLDALNPTLSLSDKATSNLNGVQDFTNPVAYTITAEDGTTVNYTITVISNSSAKQITSFVFLLTNNPIDVDVAATIDEESKTITATMPIGTPITGLLPEVELSALATIDSTKAQDFTEALEYTVTAEDGSEAIYTVTVTALLSQQEILQAILDANPGNTLDWDLQNTAELDALTGVTTNIEGQIVQLEMVGKDLVQLPSEIGQLTNLTRLDVAGNQLSSFLQEITQLTNLTSLDLGNNQVPSIPLEIGQLTNLEELSLSRNQLSSIPVQIGQLTNLKSLSLGQNNLTSLIPEIGQLTNLTSLALFRNQFTSLPVEIEQLSNLTSLTLNENEFTALPPEIEQLTNLTSLTLSRNQLTSLPEKLGQLSKLTSLRLDHNQLTSLPNEIGQLTNLSQFSVTNNQLTSLPPEIGFLLQLNSLGIFDNNLVEIPTPILQLELHNSLVVLKDEGVNYNNQSPNDVLIEIYSANPNNTLEWGVDNYPGVTFSTTGSVTEITMNNKNLARIPNNIFLLGNLKGLNINSNNIESLPGNLGEIGTLEVITAASNNLTTVPTSFERLENLALLSLTENPITNIPQEVCDLQTSNGGILTILTDPGEGCD